MKIGELQRVGEGKIGYISKNGVRSEPNEEVTFVFIEFSLEMVT